MHLRLNAQTGGADTELQVHLPPRTPSADLLVQVVGGHGPSGLGELSARSSADPAFGSGIPNPTCYRGPCAQLAHSPLGLQPQKVGGPLSPLIGFVPLSTIDFRAGLFSGVPGHCRVLSNIPGPHSLNARSTPQS